MPRVKSNVVRLKRKKQIMKAARGGFGARSKLWKAAKENVERGWRYAYPDSPAATSDLSVTGWALMFYRSARNAEFVVPKEYVDEGLDFALGGER